ncbi:YkgJ family cysteine cluster protein [Candidatus Bathyarchaeota archaeon]|nr:YkgJ family cysteine cluster protein [Candidatus Bathyarchaeota archaeon]
MDDILALITLESKNRKITDLSVTQKQFRFKCKRCAALCCKLGGPVLTKTDAARIEAAGYPVKDFLEPVNRDNKSLLLAIGGLKSREDGSCTFLQQDVDRNCFKCGIYDFRPTLCRLYPFRLESLDYNRIALKFIPCCNGLNNPEGKMLDEEIVSTILHEVTELLQTGKPL